ncbi:YdaS family helix-turn-helix protein [Mixta calida]|uniref:transcriptional regulator n=1 Tax=Mixta calida TaxID=665913 RepID=UPI00290C1875|nr:YdaS family helix-turn-helix protein [Mixta calida]MDU6539281.1 YdaS family helix-turn-helix protein [Mixta calida]
MELRKYIESLERGKAKELAEALDVSSSYLSQMASGRTAISPARCVDIENATNRVVTRKDLRPNDWFKIWPELSTA